MEIPRRALKPMVGILLAAPASSAVADEGGVSFWLPGQYGSFAATPGDAGWSLPLMYYHGQASANADTLTQRGGKVTAGIDARSDLLFALPTYTFASPVLEGQAAISAGAALARVNASAQATLASPGGAAISGAQNDARNGVSDVYVTGTLKWNRGRDNYMSYLATALPVGTYTAGRLANIGLNHWAIDAGGGYTYLDPNKGHELSAVLGFTYNFENHDTAYKNGIDAHLDWAASQFLSERTHVGLAGYAYQQLTADSGAGARLGDFKSRVYGVGPQVGHFMEVGGRKWYVNLRGYYEFGAQNRPQGWNLFLSLAIPLGAPAK